MDKKRALRELIQSKEILVVPGAFDALSAKLIEAAGFDAVYMTGFGTAASAFGFPDIGLITMTEMVENARRICHAVKIPVIADADTGYGNHINVVRTLEEYEAAGVSAIHIEDQIFPKKCGHMDRHKLISVEEMIEKIKAAVSSKKNKDFVLIARTDAISAEGFDEAIHRANKYTEGGADVIFIEAPRTLDQLERIPKFIKGPVLINVGPKTPNLDKKRFQEMGYSILLHSTICVTTSFLAIRKMLKELKGKGIITGGWAPEGISFDEFVNFLGIEGYREIERKYLREI